MLYKAASAHHTACHLYGKAMTGAILVAVVLSVIIWCFYLFFGHRVSLLFHCFFLSVSALSPSLFYSFKSFFVEYCIVFMYGPFFLPQPLPSEVGRKRKKKKSGTFLRISHRGGKRRHGNLKEQLP